MGEVTDFETARRKRVIEAFKTAAKDLIELDGQPFAEFRTDIVARGEALTIKLKVEMSITKQQRD